MGYHYHPIPGQVDVRLDGVCADFDGAAEGTHGVLGEAGLVASVGHGLRETMVHPRLRSRPRRCGRGVCVLASALPALLGGKMSRSTWGESTLVGVDVCVCVCVLRLVYHPLT